MQEITIAATFLAFADKRLQTSATDLTSCVAQLTEEQIWHRGGEYENSIANLLLHLAGDMRQWILHGIAGQPDVRERDEEFALTSQLTAAEANTLFTTTLDYCLKIIRTLQPERLLEVIDPQPTGTMRHLPVLRHLPSCRSRPVAYRSDHRAEQADARARSRPVHAAAQAVGLLPRYHIARPE
jgi:hypothetical protein